MLHGTRKVIHRGGGMSLNYCEAHLEAHSMHIGFIILHLRFRLTDCLAAGMKVN